MAILSLQSSIHVALVCGQCLTLSMLLQMNAYGGVTGVLALLCKAAQLAVIEHAKASSNGPRTMEPSGQL